MFRLPAMSHARNRKHAEPTNNVQRRRTHNNRHAGLKRVSLARRAVCLWFPRYLSTSSFLYSFPFGSCVFVVFYFAKVWNSCLIFGSKKMPKCPMSRHCVFRKPPKTMAGWFPKHLEHWSKFLGAVWAIYFWDLLGLLHHRSENHSSKIKSRQEVQTKYFGGVKNKKVKLDWYSDRKMRGFWLPKTIECIKLWARN